MRKHLLNSLFVLTLSSFASHAQTIKTYAGTGAMGNTGDNGPATACTFRHIAVIDLDTAGNLYVPDYYSHVIRKVSKTGTITTIAGTGTQGHTGDGGPATAADIQNPWGIVSDKAHNVYFVEGSHNIVRKIDAAGIITTIAGTGGSGHSGDGGPATAATFDSPADLAVDDTGNVYIADNSDVRKVNTAGIVTTFAGSATPGYSGDGIPATAAQLNNVVYIEWSKHGELYIADDINNRIRKVNAAGVISTVVGDGTSGNTGDGGPATAAHIDGQVGIALDTAGNLYLSLYNYNVIRKVTGTTISTIAGTGTLGFSGDGGDPMLATFAHPTGLILDKMSQIYVADEDNNRVRLIHQHIVNVGINETNGQHTDMRIYPNPANKGLTITADENIDHVTIISPLGEIVYSGSYNTKNVQVDVSILATGIYYIRVNGSEVRKFVKR